MKHQYFGDKRDLFKYDLILHLSKELNLKNAYFISMLTKNDKSKQGNEINYKNSIGSNNFGLIKFLKNKRDNKKEKRNANLISEYYKLQDVKIKFCVKEQIDYFSNKNRLDYFDSISKEIKNVKGILFFDPDNGLEVLNNKEKHIKYIELKKIYNEIDKSSVIVIYQHRQRFSKENNWEEYLKDKTFELEILFDNEAYFIAEDEIAFFIIAKHSGLNNKIKNSLIEYQNLYKKLFLKV